MTARTPVTSGLFASPSPLSLLTAARWLPTRVRLDSPDSPPCCSPERVHVGRTFPHLCDPRRFGKVRKPNAEDPQHAPEEKLGAPGLTRGSARTRRARARGCRAPPA